MKHRKTSTAVLAATVLLCASAVAQAVDFEFYFPVAVER